MPPILYNAYTKGLADLNSNGLSRVLTLAEVWLIYKTASDSHTAVTAVQGQQEKNVSMVLRDRVLNEDKQGASPVAHPQQQSSTASNASSFLQRSHRKHEQSQTPRDPFRQNADVQNAGRTKQNKKKTKKLSCKKGLSSLKAMSAKRDRTKSSVPYVSKCDTQRH